MSEILQSVAEFDKRVASFHQAMNPENANAKIAAAVDRLRAEFSADDLAPGVDLTPADVARKYESAARQQYDSQLRQTATELSAELAGIERGLAATAEAVSSLPHPIDALNNQKLGETTLAVEKLRIGLELDRVERRFTGRTLAFVVATYEAATDERDSTTAWFVEQHQGNWNDALGLTPTPDDAAAVMKLRRLIEARREARVAKVPELAEARERMKKLPTATLDTQIRHLTQGRGLAAVR